MTAREHVAPKGILGHLRDAAWMGARARNAVRRPAFIGLVAASVIALAIVSIALAPRHRRRVGPLPTSPIGQVDTLPILQALERAKIRVTSAESALVLTRERAVAAAAQPSRSTVDSATLHRHDSLANVLTDLQELIGKVENAPLPSSYRALAASPALITNPRVTALMDSLRDIERDRESLGSAGGADPIFVALTSQLSDIGHAVEAIASQRRDSLRATIANLTSTPSKRVAAQALPLDTMPWIAERDSAVSAVQSTTSDIAVARQQLDEQRRERERDSEISALSASPFIMVIAAAVFGIAFGFAVALWAELARPTLADEPELHRLTGARVVATVAPMRRSSEPERRKANRIAPKYLDSTAEWYQLAYLHLDQSVASPDIVVVAGDDTDVSAIVAMNLSALGADDARAVLVVDASGSSQAIRSLLPSAGVGDLRAVLSGQRSWREAAAPVHVGRDRFVGVLASEEPSDARELLRALDRDRQSLGARFDTVFVAGGLDLVPAANEVAVTGALLTAITGRTRLHRLIEAVTVLRDSRRMVFGVVLWDGPPPRLAARAQRKLGGRRKAPARVSVAASA